MSLISYNDLLQIYISEDIASEIQQFASEIFPLSSIDDSNDEKCKQEVSFTLKKDNQDIHFNKIKRSYFSHKTLRSTKKCGKVAKHELLVLKPLFRGRKGRNIHNSEYNFYKNNDKFDEIQVDAAWSGVIAWKRIGLKYENDDFEEILRNSFFIPYLTDIKMSTDDEINDIISILDERGFESIDLQYLVTTMKLKEIIDILPAECEANIKSHYQMIESVTDLEMEVKFGLTEYLRVFSTTYDIYREFQTVPMFRRVK